MTEFKRGRVIGTVKGEFGTYTVERTFEPTTADHVGYYAYITGLLVLQADREMVCRQRVLNSRARLTEASAAHHVSDANVMLWAHEAAEREDAKLRREYVAALAAIDVEE